MDAMHELVSEAISDFRKVVALACADAPTIEIKIEIANKPHHAPTLPADHMGVYAFFQEGQALKVGMAGAKSGPRFKFQHYKPTSAKSNLAKSILMNSARVGAVGVSPESVGNWIKMNTDRVNLLLPATVGRPILSLLESFLHVRWKPLFEGPAEDEE